MHILIVEDDQRLALQLKKGLEEQGHTIDLAFDGLGGLEAARQGSHDVLVLDVMLPGLDGFGLVRRLRDLRMKSPVLMLTARDSPEDIVAGLDAGADDYLTKPFALKILLARLRALSRRRTVEPKALFKVGDLVLDPTEHTVKRNGSLISLTRTEFALLECLMRNLGRVVTRSRLIESVWGSEYEIENNTLDVSVGHLRGKIEPQGTAKLIQTVRGVGYIVREDDLS